MRVLIILFSACSMLTGCVPTEAQRAEMRLKIANTCSNYGFKPGTDAYSNCLMQVDQNEANAERQRRARVAANISEINAMTRPTFCTSTPIGGGMVTTRCN